ncbi:hypothetical protein EB796_019487 [Bugula neritina]|uniref:Uncharacterized protein n=1 Tax=Bugula neritina TaxID=10212 RepID=A0A7J7J7K2_BUGNE|nr:hypothetical protein EB796_019487 [Bugula neritina]
MIVLPSTKYQKTLFEAPNQSTALSHDPVSDKESSQLGQLNTVTPHQAFSCVTAPHEHVSAENTMDNMTQLTEAPYLVDSVVAAPHQDIPATVAVHQAVSTSTRSDEPFKSKVRNCKVTVKVQGENIVYPFEDHMNIEDLKHPIGKDCVTRILDEDKSRCSDCLRLGLVDVPFSIFVKNQETLVTERVNNRQLSQQLSAANAANNFQYVQTPEQAIQLMEYVHNQLTGKRAKSIQDALKPTGKCRKTIDRFRYIYYLSVLDKDKLDEIIGQWMDNAKKRGMCALGKLCEEATDWSKVVEAANEGKLTIFGRKKDK